MGKIMEKLFCGFAESDITPKNPSEIFQDGYGYKLEPANAIRDEIKVKICALDCRGEKYIIAVFDVCGLNNELNERMRAYISLFT